MPIINEIDTAPQKATLPNGQQRTIRLQHVVFEVKGDHDAKELSKIFSQGVDITCIVGRFVFYRKAIDQKIQL